MKKSLHVFRNVVQATLERLRYWSVRTEPAVRRYAGQAFQAEWKSEEPGCFALVARHSPWKQPLRQYADARTHRAESATRWTRLVPTNRLPGCFGKASMGSTASNKNVELKNNGVAISIDLRPWTTSFACTRRVLRHAQQFLVKQIGWGRRISSVRSRTQLVNI
jgi:hypothetical protein